MLGRLVADGGWGSSVRSLGGNRSGEMRITRFLHSGKVTTTEMLSTASARTCSRACGRHVLAIQDTTSVRVDEKGIGLSVHPLIAVEATSGFVLGLVDAFFLDRRSSARYAKSGPSRRRTAGAGSTAPKARASFGKRELPV